VSENLGAKKVLHEMKIVCLINIRHNVTFVVTVASVEVRFASLAGPSFSGSFFSFFAISIADAEMVYAIA
jgi:hypothetical protein